MEQFRNATKSLGRDASRKKNHHGIFSQHHEESSDYESEDNNDNYNEYMGKSKAAKSKSSVSLLKDFLHFSSSHSLSKSSKSKHGTCISLLSCMACHSDNNLFTMLKVRKLQFPIKPPPVRFYNNNNSDLQLHQPLSNHPVFSIIHLI